MAKNEATITIRVDGLSKVVATLEEAREEIDKAFPRMAAARALVDAHRAWEAVGWAGDPQWTREAEDAATFAEAEALERLALLFYPDDTERIYTLNDTPPALLPTLSKGLRVRLLANSWEGIVWHHPDGRMAKLKRRDFPEVR